MRALRIALVLMALGACTTSDLALRADDDFTIQRPDAMERVELPVTVRWKAKGVPVAEDLKGPGPFYAVFVDRAPVAPGTGLRTLIDDECRARTSCPDLAWFAERNIYVTGKPEVTIRDLRAVGGTRVGADDAHRLTVVLIGEDGVRLDERAASIEFEVAEP